MPRLTVLVTTPRLPAGLLTGTAWRALHEAALVVTDDDQTPLALSLAADGLVMTVLPDVTAAELLERAEANDVVWLAGADGEETLIHSLAASVVSRADDSTANQVKSPEVEILVGSYDPVGSRVLDLVEVMDRLRRDCPWDRQQTHESLVRYLLEEAYETIDAIETGDRGHLQEELGDLLLQVVFHARVASEDHDEPFGIDDVADGIVEKLIRRHPHVFGNIDAADIDAVERNWDAIKAVEKPRQSSLDGIPLGLPALSLADKVIGRGLKGVADLSVPVPAESAYTAESLGDVLFALVAAGHSAGIDPEQALRLRVSREMEELRLQEQRALRGLPSDPK